MDTLKLFSRGPMRLVSILVMGAGINFFNPRMIFLKKKETPARPPGFQSIVVLSPRKLIRQ